MSANRYEIEDTCPGVIGVRLGANTWYVDDDQPEARAIRQLLADLAALTAERDALRAELDRLRALCNSACDWLESRSDKQARLFHAAHIRSEVNRE